MKSLSLFILLFGLSLQSFAASTTAHPFQLEFSAPKGALSPKSELIQTCRYEKFVIGDSAQYHVKSKSHALSLTQFDEGSETRFKVSLKEKKVMSLRGMFKPTKECASQLKIRFEDQKYAVGWAGKFDEPISFTVETPYYAFKSGDSELDISVVRDLIDTRFIQFRYKPVVTQVNVWLTVDGEVPPSIFPTSAAKNSETNRPYVLRK